MVLATIIRTEMAYPGVGVMAGDNSQYLSVVSAHGVIMVFFMAMPLLFGFFTNFLLPTQLGVHDVAFPRMNSAAFWFLPASLVVLAQLVCVDRRYQRMNCFNTKELQSLVRKRFFFEVLDSNQFNENLNVLAYATKFKNNEWFLNQSPSSFYSFYNLYLLSLKNTTLIKNLNISNDTEKCIEIKPNTAYFQDIFSVYVNMISNVIDFVLLIQKCYENAHFYIYHNWGRLHPVTNKLWDKIMFQYFLINISYLNNFTDITYFNNRTPLTNKTFSKYNEFSDLKPHLSILKLINNNLNFFFLESYANNRYIQSQNPSFLFKVKIGNYLPDKPLLNNFDHLFNTFNAKTGQNKNSLWFNSTDVFNIFKEKNSKWSGNFIELKGALIDYSWLEDNKFTINSILYSHIDIFYFINYLLNYSTFLNILNIRWSFANYLDYKFIKIFCSQNKQTLTFNNWKNLKLSREGWRCRLLLARNQSSLYKRYTNEADLVWVVEKNAKDLIPGWAMITPFSSRLKYTLIGKTDIGLWVVVFTLVSSIISCSNFLITYRYLSTLNNRKMRDARSFFSEAIITTCWMTICANPMLILGILMLLSDRHWKTSFFDYSGGGDTVLFQHMFWFFGHPEVYIIVIPCFGFVNTILSFYLRKRISARASLMYSMYTIAFLGFFVWGHHMYMVGLAHTTRMLYSTLTVMISVPAATKIMHWLITFVNSSVHIELPLFFLL